MDVSLRVCGPLACMSAIAYAPTMADTTHDRSALTTLRYWGDPLWCHTLAPGDHEDAAYDGMCECIDSGLLVHNSTRDTYRVTTEGAALLSNLDAAGFWG